MGTVVGGLEAEIGGDDAGGAGLGLGGGGESMEVSHASRRVFECWNISSGRVELRGQPRFDLCDSSGVVEAGGVVALRFG